MSKLLFFTYGFRTLRGFPYSSADKESACSAGDPGSIPGLGRSPGEGKGCPLQYSGLENSMDRIVHGPYSPWGRKESDRTEQLSLSPTWTRHRNLQPIVSNQIQQCTKRNTHLNQVGFISDVQGWFNILKLIHNQQMKVKPHDYIK